MNVPNGLQEIKDTFGDITQFIESDGTLSQEWEDQYLDHVPLPFPIKLAWNQESEVTKIWCHKLMVPVFEQVFQVIVDQNLILTVQTYGGCFEYRAQRGSTKVSTHAWGIAIDLNPLTNEQGTTGNQDPRLTQVFTDAGFTWGGTFTGKRQDPMHYEFATGY